MNHTYLQQQIQLKYTEYGFDKGWRLWYHPISVLEKSPQVLFLGINPGGSGHNSNHGVYSQEGGCAYMVEQWGSNSQVKDPVPELFKTAGLDIRTAAISNFVPFRSEGEAKLKQNPHYKLMLSWCDNLWSDLLAELSPKLIVSIGALPRDGLRRVLGKPTSTKEDSAVSSSRSACRFRIDSYRTGAVETVLSLPYPNSRYRLLSDHLLLPYTQMYLQHARKSMES